MEVAEIISLDSIVSVLVLFLLMVVMIVVYSKLRVFLVILVIFLFSLVMGMNAIEDITIPFSPYLQMFFLLFQTIIFILTSLGAYKEFKNEES